MYRVVPQTKRGDIYMNIVSTRNTTNRRKRKEEVLLWFRGDLIFRGYIYNIHE